MTRYLFRRDPAKGNRYRVAVFQFDKPNEKPGTSKTGGALSNSSEPEGQEFLYSVRVSFDEMQMQVDGKLVNLSPGMAVTVEIKKGTRRVIEYLMSPLLRYRQESLRER